MNKFLLLGLAFVGLYGCSGAFTDIASFKDPYFASQEPVKRMALVVNNTTMQNINRVQSAIQEELEDNDVDVVFLDHYKVNPPTRNLSEEEFKKSLKDEWNADALLFVNVVSEFGRKKGVDANDTNAEVSLAKAGTRKYTTVAYGKYTASLLDVKTWKTMWKADLISIDEEFKDNLSMYEKSAEKIVYDLLKKGFLVEEGKRPVVKQIDDVNYKKLILATTAGDNVVSNSPAKVQRSVVVSPLKNNTIVNGQPVNSGVIQSPDERASSLMNEPSVDSPAPIIQSVPVAPQPLQPLPLQQVAPVVSNNNVDAELSDNIY